MRANIYAAQASAADLENVRLSVQAELAVDYYELRAQDSLKELLDSTVIAYQDTLDLTASQYKAGLGNDEAVAQAEAQLKAAQAQDTNLGILRAQYEHAIAVLIGQPASTFSLPSNALAANPPAIPVGIPSELLERRPDIAAAERSVAQANAQIGVAKAAYFPTILLSASGGFGTSSVANWFTWPSRFWSVGPSLAETIFDAGLRKATVQQYRATYDQTVANYQQTVLTAFQQVEDNLASLRILSQDIEQQDAAVEAATRSLQEATVRYKAGLDPYLNVIAAQTILLNDQQTAVTFRMQQMVAASAHQGARRRLECLRNPLAEGSRNQAPGQRTRSGCKMKYSMRVHEEYHARKESWLSYARNRNRHPASDPSGRLRHWPIDFVLRPVRCTS